MRSSRRVTGLALGAMALVLAGGCTTTAVPQGPAGPLSSPSPSSPAASIRPSLYAEAEPATDDGGGDFVDGANDSDADESPTFTADELSDQVERAARQYVTKTSTRGYPDKGDKDYRRRTRDATTDAGFSVVSRLDDQRRAGATSAKLYERRERTRARITMFSASLHGTDRASVRVELRLVTERKSSGQWKTVTTGQSQEQTLSLLDSPGGGWLVDSVG